MFNTKENSVPHNSLNTPADPTRSPVAANAMVAGVSPDEAVPSPGRIQPAVADNLFVAADHAPEIIDRRKSAQRVGRDRRKNARVAVGLEVSPSGVAIAYYKPASSKSSVAAAQPALKTEFVAFAADSGPATGDWTTGELSRVLCRLVEQHRLSGNAVSVALGGGPCVTRAWFGENAEVDASIVELLERTNRYLLLGRGPKVTSYSEQQIDAKRKRAWLSVAHQDVVEAVASAVKEAGLRLTRVEHTLTAMCRAIGSTGHDRDEAVLLLNTRQGRPELAVSFRGKLLLDYRPATIGLDEKQLPENAAAYVIGKHIKCVRRYLQLQTPRGTKELRKVCQPGGATLSAKAAEQLGQVHGLEAVAIPVESLCDGLERPEQLPACAEVLTAVWMARDTQPPDGPEADLMHSIKNTAVVSWGALAKTFWPLAACAVLLLALHTHSLFQARQLVAAQAQLDALQPQRIEYEHTKAKLVKQVGLNKQLLKLMLAVEPANWNEIVKFSGRALPQGTWLKSIQVGSDAQVVLAGASYTDDAIYDYVNQLRDSAVFERVTLGGTKSVRYSGGPAFEFEITTTALLRQHAESENVAFNTFSPRL